MKISFVIPALNCSKTLYECLSGILNQSKLPSSFEVILVLSNAKQEEVNIANAFIEKLNLKIIHTNAKNRSFSRNLGAEKSNGEFLAFIDSDVKIDAFWLINLIPILEQNKLIAAAQGSFEMDKATDDYGKLFSFVPKIEQCITSTFGPVIVTGACLYRAKIFFELGKFDENVLWNEDLNLSVTAFRNGYGLTYQKTAKAILLNNKTTIYGIVKRNYISGKYYYFLLKHKFSNPVYWKNINYMKEGFLYQIKRILPSSNKFIVKILCFMIYISKILGYTYSYLFTRRKKMYSFPLYFKPYRGLRDVYLSKFDDFGLVILEDKNYLLNSKSKQLICIQ